MTGGGPLIPHGFISASWRTGLLVYAEHQRALGLSRPGARCRDCSRTVSPGRSPNPACGSHRTGLSTVAASGAGWQSPGIGDRIAPVSISGYRHRCQVIQLDPVCRDRLPSPFRGGEPLADVFPPPTMQRSKPPHPPPPHEVGEATQSAFAGGMSEVVGPPAHDLT